jgi:hypothetical protein
MGLRLEFDDDYDDDDDKLLKQGIVIFHMWFRLTYSTDV